MIHARSARLSRSIGTTNQRWLLWTMFPGRKDMDAVAVASEAGLNTGLRKIKLTVCPNPVPSRRKRSQNTGAARLECQQAMPWTGHKDTGAGAAMSKAG